jgi:hypothetical protein
VPPVLSETPVDISGPYDPSDSTYGDIKFISPVILPFGVALDAHRLSPAIEYFTVPGATVRAVTHGVIESIRENPVEQGDYEIHITSLPGSDFLVVYDHVLSVAVIEGALVDPGDSLGVAGTWTDNMRRTELQINVTDDAGNNKSYCPLNYGDSSFVEQHIKLLREYNNRGFSPHYDTLCLTDMVIP